MAATLHFSFFKGFYYSPWSERENWPFLKVAISPKPEKPHVPKLVCMHVTSTPTCKIFLSRFQSIKFFDDHGLYMVRKGKLAVFESSNITENGEATRTIIGVYACYINTYLQDFFEPILSDKIFG